MFRATNKAVNKVVSPEQQFITEAGKGNVDFIKKQLAVNPEWINKTDSRGSTALVAAAANGHLAVVEFLVTSKNVNVNKTGENGYSALLWAAFNNQIAVVEVLLGAGAEVGVQDKYGNTPLYCAVSKKNLPMIQLLLQQPGNLFDAKHKQTKLTALELAKECALNAEEDQSVYKDIVRVIEAAQQPVMSSSYRSGM